MIKLYIFYFVLGGFMLFNSWGIWYFSNFSNGDNIVTYSVFFSSAALFLIAPGLVLYHPKQAAIVGMIALIVMFPFGIHWLIYRYTYEQPLLQGALNQMFLLATVLYIMSVFYSIRYIVIYHNQEPQEIGIKRFRLSFSVLPISIFVVFAIWILLS